jgi:metal-responsive CopG/Arc/MetJ family transcriptional regulator
MKKPKGVSLEERLYERIQTAAKDKRESTSKWIEDAIYERFERMDKTVKETEDSVIIVAESPKPSISYSKDFRRKKKKT